MKKIEVAQPINTLNSIKIKPVEGIRLSKNELWCKNTKNIDEHFSVSSINMPPKGFFIV